jgi:hypothetical protein
MEANASRYRGKAPDEIAWTDPERQTRAVKEYLAALEAETEPNPDRKLPKVILSQRSLLGLDGKGQQAGAVRLWAQLSHRHRQRDHCRR